MLQRCWTSHLILNGSEVKWSKTLHFPSECWKNGFSQSHPAVFTVIIHEDMVPSTGWRNQSAPCKDWWEIKKKLNYMKKNRIWFCLQRERMQEMKTIQKAADADCSVYKHLLDGFSASLVRRLSHVKIAAFAWRQPRRCCLFAEQLPLTGTLILPFLLLLLLQSCERRRFIWRRTNKTSNRPHPDEWNASVCQKHFFRLSCRNKRSTRHAALRKTQFDLKIMVLEEVGFNQNKSLCWTLLSTVVDRCLPTILKIPM